MLFSHKICNELSYALIVVVLVQLGLFISNDRVGLIQ